MKALKDSNNKEVKGILVLGKSGTGVVRSQEGIQIIEDSLKEKNKLVFGPSLGHEIRDYSRPNIIYIHPTKDSYLIDGSNYRIIALGLFMCLLLVVLIVLS